MKPCVKAVNCPGAGPGPNGIDDINLFRISPGFEQASPFAPLLRDRHCRRHPFSQLSSHKQPRPIVAAIVVANPDNQHLRACR